MFLCSLVLGLGFVFFPFVKQMIKVSVCNGVGRDVKVTIFSVVWFPMLNKSVSWLE